MSVSLVKKSLELVSDKSQSTGASKEAKEKRGKKSKRKTPADEKKNAVLIVEKIREKTKAKTTTNKVEENVQKLLNLSKTNTLHKKLQTKLIHKVAKKKEECVENKKKQESVFTEEDFAKFEREYFVN